MKCLFTLSLVLVFVPLFVQAQFQPPVVQPQPAPQPTVAHRQGILNVRLVRVTESKEVGTVDPGLKDVLPLLKANLRYSSYHLVEDRNLKLKPGVQQELPDGFKVHVSDIDNMIMTVYIDRHMHSLLRTRLKLRVGRPLVVGPFRDPQGTSGYILIFTLKN